MRELVTGKLLRVMVPTVDGPMVGCLSQHHILCLIHSSTHEELGEACQLTKYMAVL